MDYVMHSSIPEPPAPRLQHPPITGAGTCPYSVAHRVDHHGSPLPSPNYNSVSSLLSPVRNPLHSSSPPHLLSQQQQQHNHHAHHAHAHAHAQAHHHHQHTNSQPHSHSHSHSQSHPHHPYDPVHPPPSTNHWFSHHQPPAPQPPHWAHQFGAPDTRSSSSSGLFAPQQLPSLFPALEHHHHHSHPHQQYMGGAGGSHHNNNNNGNSSSSNNGGSASSSTSNLHSNSSSSSGGSGLGAGPAVNPLLVTQHSLGQSLDPFASSWSLFRQHPHRLPESAQRFNPGPHAHLGNPQQQHPTPANAASAPAVSPRTLPNPTMPEHHGQTPPANSQQPEYGSFSHSSSTSPSSSARASPNPTGSGSPAHSSPGTSGRPLHEQQGPQTPTRSEANLGSQPRSNGSPQGPAIATSPSVSPPALTPVAAGGMDQPAGRSGPGGHVSISDSERRRSTPSHRRSAVEVHVSDDDSDSSEEHMEEMFIQQLGAAGHPYTVRMNDFTEDRIRRQQLLRGALNNKRIASKGALASLQSVDIDSLPENERTCVICYNEFGIPNPEGINEAPLRLPKCKHVFGDHCIKKWFEESDSCPYCRDKVPSEPARRLTARSVNNIFAAALPDGRPAL
ncbi:hypothetical protein MAPG_06345 [Magnaporthiopsis poae ATCC 64411]|uniref:RING-type domain-containing protein n=1 Tax=Magnaporthiopsis poae (strain ATCC 64411 / 73-15) TaxID=644358 RepID=A0A0C4E1S6_MAGP6|nr:hypothetical protein MAPG_06345 [Magnaporthiopsis poae ATCC 64411]